MSSENSKETNFDRSMKFLSSPFRFAYWYFRLCWLGLKGIKQGHWIVIVVYVTFFGFVTSLIKKGYHLDFICFYLPESFSWPDEPFTFLGPWAVYKNVWRGLYHSGIFVNYTLGHLMFSSWAFASYGQFMKFKVWRQQKKLDLVGLKAGNGPGPRIVSTQKIKKLVTNLIISSPGVGLAHYESKREDLEYAFGIGVKQISQGPRPGLVSLTLSSEKLPTKCLYSKLATAISGPYEFIVGQHLDGTLTKKLDHLPHMLAGGTTGQGKSGFIKQAILGLTEHSNNFQIYIVDLKQGAEMRDFSVLPHARVASTEFEAKEVLGLLVDEMKRRQRYLAAKGHEEISPERDEMDVILLVIDEASVLYAKSKTKSELDKVIDQARDYTDLLTKQARTARIHVILATQKVSKDTIETRVQDNIAGRLCFRVSSIHGSINVIGTADATKLPATKGRAIWRHGLDLITLQVPHVERAELHSRLKDVAEKYRLGEKTNFSKIFQVEKKTSKDLEIDHEISISKEEKEDLDDSET